MLFRRCHFFVALVLTTLLVAYRALNGHMALVLVDAASRAGAGQQAAQQAAPAELLPQEAVMTTVGPGAALQPLAAQPAAVAPPAPAGAGKGRAPLARVETASQTPSPAVATKPPARPGKCPEPPPVGPLEEPPSGKVKRDIRRDLAGQ